MVANGLVDEFRQIQAESEEVTAQLRRVIDEIDAADDESVILRPDLGHLPTRIWAW
jgi:hypothetical protein